MSIWTNNFFWQRFLKVLPSSHDSWAAIGILRINIDEIYLQWLFARLRLDNCMYTHYLFRQPHQINQDLSLWPKAVHVSWKMCWRHFGLCTLSICVRTWKKQCELFSNLQRRTSLSDLILLRLPFLLFFNSKINIYVDISFYSLI